MPGEGDGGALGGALALVTSELSMRVMLIPELDSAVVNAISWRMSEILLELRVLLCEVAIVVTSKNALRRVTCTAARGRASAVAVVLATMVKFAAFVVAASTNKIGVSTVSNMSGALVAASSAQTTVVPAVHTLARRESGSA